jgi:hypothetical protein
MELDTHTDVEVILTVAQLVGGKPPFWGCLPLGSVVVHHHSDMRLDLVLSDTGETCGYLSVS